MSKHTPGPWDYEGGVVMSCGGTKEEHFESDKKRGLGPVKVYLGQPQVVAELIRNATDGALIAAAPELLAACEALIKSDDLQRAIDLAHTALAKLGAA